jgi:DNA-binding NarL/FixJ family response regulator
VLADPHPRLLDGLQPRCGWEPNGQVLACGRPSQEILQAIRQHRPDLMILDLGWPDRDDLAVLRQRYQEGIVNVLHADAFMRQQGVGFPSKSPLTPQLSP